MAKKFLFDFVPPLDVDDIEPPVEGWHKVCEIKDHNWVLEIEEGRINVSCTDPCPDLNVYDPSGFTPACERWWENEDCFSDPIPIDVEVIDDSTPAGPWGPAEYGFYIKLGLKQPDEYFPPDEVVVQEMKDAHDRIVERESFQRQPSADHFTCACGYWSLMSKCPKCGS